MRRRDAYGLLEMLGAAIILAIIVSVVATNYQKVVLKNFEDLALQRFVIIAQAIRFYEIDQGSLPAGLNDLLVTTSPSTGRNYLNEMPFDPFVERRTDLSRDQKQFLWIKNSNLLKSVGPDQTAGTGDDLCFDVQRFERVSC